CASLGGAAW
nr:immunoglobulin heavy chain junction region [Homo sapiens]